MTYAAQTRKPRGVGSGCEPEILPRDTHSVVSNMIQAMLDPSGLRSEVERIAAEGHFRGPMEMALRRNRRAMRRAPGSHKFW